MKITLSIFLLLLLSLGINAQELTIPKNYKLETNEDYKPLEDKVVECIDWLMEVPLNKQVKKREAASKFVMDWINGSPDVSVIVDMKLLNFYESSPHLLFSFISGWAKKSIETEKHDDVVQNGVAALEAVIQFYQKNKSLTGKDSKVEKLIKMQDKGKLEAHVKKHLIH